MVVTGSKPPQPIRAMVLAVLMIPWSLWILVVAGMYAGTLMGAIYLVDGLVAFVAAFLILANTLTGRWMATAWGGYTLLTGLIVLSVVFGFRWELGAGWLVYGSGFGLFVAGIGVLIIWMAFPPPHEQALHREAREARRLARLERPEPL